MSAMADAGQTSKSSRYIRALSIKIGLQHLAQEKKSGPKTRPIMFRIRPRVKALNVDIYAPEVISLGLFDRFPSITARGDKCRLEVALVFLRYIRMTEDDWDRVASLVVSDPKEIHGLYDDEEQLSEDEVQNALALDAIFVACYLGALFYDGFDILFPAFTETILAETQDFRDLVLDDITKLENQIPLTLIRNVLAILYDKLGELEEGRKLEPVDCVLTRICANLVVLHSGKLPGFHSPRLMQFIHDIPFQECAHVVECLHRVLCYQKNGEDVSNSDINALSDVSLPSVTQLQEAGIEFRGHTSGLSDVQFKAGLFKAVLYIPRVDFIGDDTEALWRNLLAYESVCSSQKEFTCFLDFMDDLIDQEEDVTMLRKGKHPVIVKNGLGDDKAVADLFNSVLKHSSLREDQKWSKLRKNIHSYYHQKYRLMYVEFMRTNFGSPWVTISVVAAVVLLILTFLQTIYTMLPFYFSSCNC